MMVRAIKRPLLIFLMVTGLATVLSGDEPAADQAGELAWQRGDTSVALFRGDAVVWQYNFGPQQSKPYFHPLNLPALGTLTWEAPPDHPWHHGLWFSWKLIDGVNYWEENRQTGKSAGLTTWSNVSIETGEDHSARIILDLAYHPPRTAPVLTEKRLIEVSPPAADGGYHIDWTATFRAGERPVVLDRTPLPHEPNGQPYGGYAGLSIRLAKHLAHFEAVDSEQQHKQQSQRARFRARAVDYAGSVDDRAGGIAVLDHPANLNAPSPWYIIRDTRTPMTYFSPAVIQAAAHTLAAGDSFTLRYRILVHAGRLDAAELLKHYQHFAQTASPDRR